MYETFYGLSEIPFSTSPSPRFAYPSAENKVAMAKMRYAADQKLGLAVLTGPIGSGKTTTAHQLLEIGPRMRARNWRFCRPRRK